MWRCLLRVIGERSPLQTSALGERKPRLLQHTQPRRDATRHAQARRAPGRAEAAPRSAHTTTPRRNGNVAARTYYSTRGKTPERGGGRARNAPATTTRHDGHAARMPQYKACFTHARSTRLHSHNTAGLGRDTPLPQASLGSLDPLAPAPERQPRHTLPGTLPKGRG